MQLYYVVSNSFGVKGVNVLYREVPLFLISTYLSIFFYIIYQTIYITIPITLTTTINLTNYVILTLDLTSKDVKQAKTLPIS